MLCLSGELRGIIFEGCDGFASRCHVTGGFLAGQRRVLVLMVCGRVCTVVVLVCTGFGEAPAVEVKTHL